MPYVLKVRNGMKHNDIGFVPNWREASASCAKMGSVYSFLNKCGSW